MEDVDQSGLMTFLFSDDDWKDDEDAQMMIAFQI
jgi:hypothetical protein